MKIDEVVEYMDLIYDNDTVVSYSYNVNGSVLLDAYVRPYSRLKDRYINPHRNMSGIELLSVKECPRCDVAWDSSGRTIEGNKPAHIPCVNKCGMSIDSILYSHLIIHTRGSINIEEPTGESMPRADNNEHPFAGVIAIEDDNPFAGIIAINNSPQDIKQGGKINE